jgi:DNA-directed RNA polymerase subunit RPC12/RpoP
MPNQFASGKYSIAECDRCGQQFKLKQLKEEIIKTKRYNLLVCPECWDPDQPQLQLGMYPVYDPQAVRNPRRDTTYVTSGTNVDGFPSGGSRDIQWGWNPVGGSSQYDNGLTPNYLALTVSVGTVTISTSA